MYFDNQKGKERKEKSENVKAYIKREVTKRRICRMEKKRDIKGKHNCILLFARHI